MTERQENAVSVALSVLFSNLHWNNDTVKGIVEEAIRHREMPPRDFRQKCIVVLHEAITRKGFFEE